MPRVASDNVAASRVSGSASTGTPRPAPARRRQTRVTTATDDEDDRVEVPLRVALLSYRSKPHCGGPGIYLRHVSRELAALGHHAEGFSGQPHPQLHAG